MWTTVFQCKCKDGFVFFNFFIWTCLIWNLRTYGVINLTRHNPLPISNSFWHLILVWKAKGDGEEFMGISRPPAILRSSNMWINLTQLYCKCKSVTLMSNWLKFGEIVPFGGGSTPQPTTLPTVAVPCSPPPPLLLLGNALHIFIF